MASVITLSGEQLFAAKAQANEQLDIDTFIFANVPNQDPSAPINREEGIPTAHIVYQQNVQQVGRINDNVVVYSTVLDSITGPFEFNWVGLYSSVNQKLVAINHVPTVTKTASTPGEAGNTLNRNFGIEYSGIAELTGIVVDQSTWQIDYTARLSGMDKLTQQLAADMNGKDWFIDDGLKVVPRATANSFSVMPGVGYVSGLRVELKQEHILIVQTYPQFVYVDAWFSGNANSTWSPQLAFTVTNTEMDDYIDPSGTQHYVYKLAVINESDNIDDLRRYPIASEQNFSKNFNNIYQMLSRNDLVQGRKVSTGSTTWKLVNNDKGLETATNGIYAIPLNGVSLSDAGADINAEYDSTEAIEYILGLYNADNKNRFTITGNGGSYLVRKKIVFHDKCGFLRFSGNGSKFTITENADGIFSWGGLTSVHFKDIELAVADDVEISGFLLQPGGEINDASKTTRLRIRDVSAFDNVKNSAGFIKCRQMWESKIIHPRSDISIDVDNLEGSSITLEACVNSQIIEPELGYCNFGIHLTTSPNVEYKNEGIDIISPVITYSKIAIKGDNITALKVNGGVLDFCEIRAADFTNGHDAAFFGTWIANRSDSENNPMIVGVDSFSSLRLIGVNFINNNPNINVSAASINSHKSKIIGCTSGGSGLVVPGFRKIGTIDYGNDFAPTTQTNVSKGIGEIFIGDDSVAPFKKISSGIEESYQRQLLSRLTLDAPLLNSNNTINIDHVQGNFSDQPIIILSWGDVGIYELELATGNIKLLKNGAGIQLSSPDGQITKRLTLSASGELELI